MNKPPIPSRVPQPVAPATYEDLDAVLRELLAENERLLAHAIDHREAIKRADAAALNAAIVGQNTIVQRIAALERRRQAIVAYLSPAPKGASHAAAQIKVSSVIAGAPEPIRSRIAALAAALRELLNKLHREHQAVRSAAETLSAHMEGLMRHICRGLSHAGTYARCGSIDSSVQVISAVDMRS